jgi:Abnormal spindle-like microcephaly-assoc'd, ASPM-SPD-2-Hydin
MRRIDGWRRAQLRVALALGAGVIAAVAMCVPLGSAAPALTGPNVTLSPTSVAFGDQPVGTRSDARSVTLTNTGDTPLTISTIHLTGSDTQDFGVGAMCPINPDVLPAGASCEIYVAFAPDSAGTKSATLEIGDDGPDSPQSVALSGNGIGGGGGTPAATVTPGSLSFGDDVVGNKTDAQPLTLTNTGDAPLIINTLHLDGAVPGDFSQGTDCPVSPGYLPAGASCTIYVAFTPHSPGSKSATLEIGDNAPDSPQAISLTGNGILAGAISLSPSSLAFGDQLVGTRSDAQAVTVTNTGEGPVAITSFQITGQDAAAFAQGALCPVSPEVLLPGQSCTIYVSFGPASGGQKTANLVIGDNAPDSPQTVALTGNAISTPQVTLQPGQLSFGSVTLGTSAPSEALTLSDTGGGPLHIGTIGIAGAAAADFAETSNCPATLAVGSSCTLGITFTPTAEGTRTASLTVHDDATGGQQAVALAGAGVDPGTYLDDNFESGSLAQWAALSSTGSTIALDSTNAHSGTTSVRIRNSGGDESSRLYANLEGGGHAQSYTHFCFEIAPGLTDGIEIANGRAITTEYPLGIRRWVITYNPYTHGLEGYFFNENLDRLDLYIANGQVLPGDWHCVQLYLDESLNGQAQMWLDGTPEGTVTGDLSTPSPFDRMYLWNQPSAGTVWFDDVKVADAPIG